jgi:hypothetical protein
VDGRDVRLREYGSMMKRLLAVLVVGYRHRSEAVAEWKRLHAR